MQYTEHCHLNCRTRLVSLASQSFIASIVHDSLELQKQARTAPQQKLKDQGYNIKDKRFVLSMVDVSEALQQVLTLIKHKVIIQHSGLKVLCDCSMASMPKSLRTTLIIEAVPPPNHPQCLKPHE